MTDLQKIHREQIMKEWNKEAVQMYLDMPVEPRWSIEEIKNLIKSDLCLSNEGIKERQEIAKRFNESIKNTTLANVPQYINDLHDRVSSNKIDFSSGRSNTWFYLSLKLANVYDLENLISFLDEHFYEEQDFKRKEFIKCIESGYKFFKQGDK